jgi:SAM-dependent methyltransferase
MSATCILCGKESRNVVWSENGYAGIRCACGLLFVSPRPAEDEVRGWCNSEDADIRARGRIGSEIAARIVSRYRLKLLKGFLPEGTILEIGSGGGYFLEESKRMGFTPFGIELNLKEAEFIRERLKIPVEVTPLSRDSFKGLFFDGLCHFDVISHFYDPVSEFRKFHDRLKEGGILLFETGNGGDLSKMWLRFIGHLQFPEHLFLFSIGNIEQFCNQAGFRIVKTYRYSIVLHLAALKLFGILRRMATKASANRSGRRRTGGALEEGRSGGSPQLSRGVILAFKICSYVNFFIRYRMGRLLPKIGPQTIIYVARRV